MRLPVPLVLLLLVPACASTPVRPPEPPDALEAAADTLPTLPATHARLSAAFGRHHHARTGGQGRLAVALPPSAQEEEVEPARAAAVTAEAVRMLEGRPTPAEVDTAWADLAAACRVHHLDACAYLRDHYAPPQELVPGRLPPDGGLRDGIIAARCLVARTGRVMHCKAFESPHPAYTDVFLRAEQRTQYRAATLAGHPVEAAVTWEVHQHLKGCADARVEALQRTDAFPASPQAWHQLAAVRAALDDEGPALAEALERACTLDPLSGWACAERAWLHVRAGEAAQALPLAERGWRTLPFHPYVVETYAAALAASGRCAEAAAEQRRALELLTPDWPEPERARFRANLATFEAGCGAPASAAR